MIPKNEYISPHGTRIGCRFIVIRIALALMETCRQIRKEMVAMFYSQNIFLYDIPYLNLTALYPEALASLRHIEISAFYVCTHSHLQGYQSICVLIDLEDGTTLRTDKELFFPCRTGVNSRKCFRHREEYLELMERSIASAGLLERKGRLKKRQLRDLSEQFQRGRHSFWVSVIVGRTRSMARKLRDRD